MLLAHILGATWLLEQPSSSLLREHTRFQWMLQTLDPLHIPAAWLL